MKANEIRQAYLDFFQSKGHQIVPSAPIVNKDDPTLLFTNAGMNQFKDYFLGNQVSRYKRIADTQKCLRVSGKHNDLEEVGIDTYHHTMFEMLGNWSIGDYFKEEAIAWSWELLTEVYKLPKDRLYVSVFGGDPAENLEKDMESYNFWKKWIAEDRIIFGSKKDNFWEMGDQGPCGPCSEIHVDLRSEIEVLRAPGKDLVNESDPLVVEIWNNVFIQYNRKADGKLEELPAKHVDTGMGFERLVMAVQNKKSNYDTDVFQPMISYIAAQSGIPYGQSEKTDIAMRVLSDHIRAISFVIADGQLPSNAKAGYVIRRILRRAVRYAYTFLGFKEPFLNQLVPLLAEQFKGVFPELQAQAAFVQKVVLEEENSFLRTLDTGLKRIEQLTSNFTSANKNIEGKVVFELYDTFGFPVDLVSLIARENSYTIDEAGFEVEMNIQKERSRKAAATEVADWVIVSDDDEVEFVGYDLLTATSNIVKYRTVKLKGAEEIQMVLDTTPFYAESGGQVGDTGYLTSAAGEKIKIKDTRKENNLIIHMVDRLPKDLKAKFEAKVDADRRQAIQANHSATHLLHAALKKVLGEHVNQKGSLVNDNMLRFDFSHFSKITDEEMLKVEEIVNQKIRENVALEERRSVPIAQAKQLGAMALFGEKYGEYVRMITFDPTFSRELCGGTHVKATGEIGLVKVTAESSVAAGVRRIEAVTGKGAEVYFRESGAVLAKLSDLLKQPKDIAKSLEQLINEKEALWKRVQALEAIQVGVVKAELLAKAKKIDGVNVIVQRVDLPSADAARQLAYDLKQASPSLYLIFAGLADDKPQVTVMFSDDVVEKWQLDAGKLVRELAKEINGGGGGQKFYATAGGKEAAGLDKVVAKANESLKQLN